MKKFYRITIGLFMLVLGLCYSSFFSYAEEVEEATKVEEKISDKEKQADSSIPEMVQQYASGIVRICLYIERENNEIIDIRQGSGFLIGDNKEDIAILTDNSFLNIDEKTDEIIRRQFGIDAEEKIQTGIDVVLDMNTRINLSIENKGDGFSILRSVEAIKGMSCLRLGSPDRIQVRDSLFVCAYNGESDLLNNANEEAYTFQITPCQVAEIKENEILTNYNIIPANVGSPVLDKEGYVVGMIVKNKEEILSVRSITDVRKILDTLSVKYTGEDGYNEVTNSLENELSSLLAECQEEVGKKDVYTAKSIKKMKEAINNAMAIMSDSKATADSYESAIDQLKKCKKKMQKKEYPLHVIQVVLAVIIVIFVVITVNNTKSNRKMRTEKKEKKVKEVKVKKQAKLVRIDTNETISITTDCLRIGQNTEDIDYTISDNTSISRHHADVTLINGEYYIMDCNSTTHSYVNGNMLVPGQFCKLENGDTIKLSDLEFVFYA